MSQLTKISDIGDIEERQAVLDYLGRPDPDDISPVTMVYYGHSFVNRFDTYMQNLPWYMDNLGIPAFEGQVICQGLGGATVKRLREPENINKLFRKRPDIVVIEAGTNDLARANLTAKDVSDEMLELVRDILNCHVREVIVCQVIYRGKEGMLKAVDDFKHKVVEYNLRMEYELQFLPRTTFWHHRKLWNVDLEEHLTDGTHLNDLGNKKLYRSLKGAVQYTSRVIRPAWSCYYC